MSAPPALDAGPRLFRLPGRGLVEVSGSERVRWLDGMVTNDVEALAAAGPGAGCPALLLTPQGRIVADLHLLHAEDAIWMDLEREAAAAVIERLERMLIADDVRLVDRSGDFLHCAVEGPGAPEVLAAAGVAGTPPPEGFVDAEIAGVPVRVAAWGFTAGAEAARQLWAPADRADAVRAQLLERGAPAGLAEGDAALFERLRIEAGTPRLGRELDETVLPAEARLDRAVSTTKGCYTGQEVVARLRTRDRRNHLLVGLRFDGPTPAPAGAALRPGEGDGERAVGEVTSAVESPRFGPIGLGFVRRERSEPGTRLVADGVAAVVAPLPFGSVLEGAAPAGEAEGAPDPA